MTFKKIHLLVMACLFYACQSKPSDASMLSDALDYYEHDKTPERYDELNEKYPQRLPISRDTITRLMNPTLSRLVPNCWNYVDIVEGESPYKYCYVEIYPKKMPRLEIVIAELGKGNVKPWHIALSWEYAIKRREQVFVDEISDLLDKRIALMIPDEEKIDREAHIKIEPVNLGLPYPFYKYTRSYSFMLLGHKTQDINCKYLALVKNRFLIVVNKGECRLVDGGYEQPATPEFKLTDLQTASMIKGVFNWKLFESL